MTRIVYKFVLKNLKTCLLSNSLVHCGQSTGNPPISRVIHFRKGFRHYSCMAYSHEYTSLSRRFAVECANLCIHSSLGASTFKDFEKRLRNFFLYLSTYLERLPLGVHPLRPSDSLDSIRRTSPYRRVLRLKRNFSYETYTFRMAINRTQDTLSKPYFQYHLPFPK